MRISDWSSDVCSSDLHVELGPGVGVDAVKELTGVRALDIDLAQGRGIQQADAVAHGFAFALDRSVHALAVLGEVPWALPMADVFEHGTVFYIRGKHSGEAHRLGDLPAIPAGERADVHWRIVRQKNGDANRGNDPIEGK